MAIYEFDQNNSGGYFLPPAAVVRIEADSADEANKKALLVGVYFDGCDAGRDCECCGDRWYRVGEWSKVEPVENDSHREWLSSRGLEEGVVWMLNADGTLREFV